MRISRITRIAACAGVIGALSSSGLAAEADTWRVLGAEIAGVPPERMLATYLLNLAREQLARRAATVTALAGADELAARQRYVRETIVASIGGLPERTPLRARTVGTLARDGYTVEKVIYESRPGFHVTAALYVPAPDAGHDAPPWPAVLVPCGHSEAGKAEPAYQRVCIALVKRGFVVLCYDPISQGERNQLLDAQGKAVLSGSTTEHTVIGVQCLLLGTHVARYRIWDGMRSVDYLLSRPEVDGKRIGVTGNSGGGTMTAYLVSADPRFACAAPSCYITSFRRLFETIGPQDGEQNLTRAVVDGIDHADFLEVFAPKPILVCAATHDFFDIEGTWQTLREAKRFYTALGHPERIDIVEANDKHGFTTPRRIAVVRWMRRWLQGRDDPVGDPPMRLETVEALRCTEYGEVLRDLGGKSAYDLNREEEVRLATTRRERFVQMDPSTWTARVRELAGIAAPVGRPKARPGSDDRNANATVRIDIRKVVLEPEPGIALPVRVCTPRDTDAHGRLVLYVHAKGMAAGLGRDDESATAKRTPTPIETLVGAGYRVVAVDVRGWGETDTPGNERGGLSRYASKEWKNAFLALHTGKTLLGMRTTDVLSAVSYAVGLSGGKDGVSVIGIGRAGPVVLHAALLDERIKQVIVDRGLLSWSSVLHTPLAEGQFPSVVPGALRHYDLPLLVARIGTPRVTLLNPTDATGKALTAEAARAEMDRAGVADVSIRVADTAGGGPYVALLAQRNPKP